MLTAIGSSLVVGSVLRRERVEPELRGAGTPTCP